MTPGGNPMSAPAPPARSRPAQPADYDAIAAVLDDWWGRPVLGALPRLFLDHFHATSRVIDGAAGAQVLELAPGPAGQEIPWEQVLDAFGR